MDLLELEVAAEDNVCVGSMSEWFSVSGIGAEMNFVIICLNIRSIKKHFEELNCFMKNELSKIDVIILNEFNF